MSRDINPFGLRMPPELRARLEVAAEASGRSMNAELVHRLERSFDYPEVNLTTTIVERIESRLNALDAKMTRYSVQYPGPLTPDAPKTTSAKKRR